MPVYEYRCVCGSEKEVRLSFEEINVPQVCDTCGTSLKRKVSVSNFAMKPTGKGMALDSLNSKWGGFPEGQTKPWAQQATAKGL